jgi:branched-chain amino acid transport system permease protein
MTLLSLAVQYAISGVTAGSIYAIVGICWTVVYLIAQVLNFTTGEFVMLGGMLAWVFIGAGFGLVWAGILATACTILLAILLERFVVRPIRYPSEMIYMMMTIASASVIKGIFLLGFGSETRTIESFFAAKPILILGASLTPQVMCVIGVLILVVTGLSLFINRTILGKALRASAMNLNGARLVGIDINKFRLFCFGLSGGLGALAGIVITPITFTGYSIGLMTGMKGLVAAIVAGWSITGTVLAGLALGFLEGFGAGFISTGWKDAFALLIMIVFLLAKTVPISHGKKKEKT